MPRHLVCLTFDFDGLSSWVFRKMVTPTPISRGEFAVVGADRILSLLHRHGIRATWFIPGHTIDTYPDICARVHAEGHEVGNHGYMHEPPATLSREQEEAVLLRGNESINRLTGYYPRGYRSPSWDLSPSTVELLLEHGFSYDSSQMGNDYLPYLCRHGDVISSDGPAQFGETTRLVEMPVSWSLDDYPYFEYRREGSFVQEGLRRAGDVLENWVDDFRYLQQRLEWGVINYTFHPEVTGRGHRMLMLERLIQALFDLGATFTRLDSAVAEYSQRTPPAR
jgi:peptidoglycan/xylan/chitin deacetylase (PgdA/CDA1 family)